MGNSQLTFSIILPIRNEKKYIVDTIQSILDQSYPNEKIEILIADGNSTDGTKQIIDRYAQNYSNIYIISNPEKIVSTGFNRALTKAKGDFIVRIDGHCQIPSEYLQRCYELFSSKDADIVGGILETISSGTIGSAISIVQSSIFGVGNVKFRNIGYINGGYVDTLAFGVHKRDVFEKVGGYDEVMINNQDDEFNIRVQQNGMKIWMDQSLVIKYHSRLTYKKLLKQYFNYGLYKIRGMQKRKKIFSIRSLIPSIFILILLASIIFDIFYKERLFSFNIIFFYLIANILFSVYNSKSIKNSIFIGFGYIVVHFSYGFGFLIGMIKFIKSWKKNQLIDTYFNRKKFKTGKI